MGKRIYDPDALAFILAAGITDNTQKTAINTFVIDLKNNNLWNKFHALYPIIGGNATSHRFNLKNPLNTDAAFRLSFTGPWTHDSNGFQSNGSSTWANTFLTPSTTMSLNSSSFGFYNRLVQTTNLGIPMGTQDVTFRMQAVINGTNLAGGINTVRINSSGSLTACGPYSIPDTSGFYSFSRVASNSLLINRNGVQIANCTVASTTLPTRSIFIGARNETGSPSLFALCNFSLVFIASGFSESETLTFYNIVQQYQTTLERQV